MQKKDQSKTVLFWQGLEESSHGQKSADFCLDPASLAFAQSGCSIP
jgi:hypothetical protein